MGLLCVFCALVACGLVEKAAVGQPPASAEKTESLSTTAAPRSSGSQAKSVDESAPIVIHWIDQDGKLIPILASEPGETLEQALERLKGEPTSDKSPAPPTAKITRIDLSGKVFGERATLTAVYTVEVLAQDSFVPIPLRLSEATLTSDAKHEGPGESVPGEFSNIDGYTWWLRGKGTHQLTFDMSVPVEARSPKLRMKLTLPTTAVSQLELDVNQPQVAATAQNKDSRSQPVIQETADSKITVQGLGPAFELSWQPSSAAEPGQAVLEADNTISVEFDNEAVFLKAQQHLHAIDGTRTFESVQVDLPKNAKLLSLQGPDIAGHTPDPSAPQTIVIHFTKPTLGPVELNWNVELMRPQDAPEMIVEGFHVHEAVRQSGRIGLRSDYDSRLDIDPEASKFVRRIDVDEVERYFEAVPESAFRFSKQPFQLAVEIRKVEPQLTVTPQMLLTCSSNAIEFDGKFQFRVTGGEIDTVEINWPDWQRNGWTLQPFEPQGEIIERFEEGNRITFRLSKRTAAPFSISLKAQRTVADEQEPLDFDLPAADAARHQPAVVVVAMHDNVQMQFEPEGETVARLLVSPPPNSPPLPESLRDRRYLIYEVESIPRRFTGRLSTHKKLVQTSTIVKLVPGPTSMTVRQTISYTVAWGRQASVSLLVPNALKGRVQFTSDDADELTPALSQNSSSGDSHQIDIPLINPRTRRFHVIAEFDVDDNSSEQPTTSESKIVLPIIKSLDSPYATTTFEVERSPSVQVDFSQSGWRPQTDASGTPTWNTNGEVESIPVTLFRIGGKSDSTGVVITKALVQTVIDSAGTAVMQLDYQLKQTPDRIELVMPAGHSLLEVQCDGDELSRQGTESSSESPEHYVFDLPPVSEATERSLVIRYRMSTGRPFAVSGSYQLSIPHITGEVWAGQSIWEVVVPRDQILFLDPAGFTSQNRWTRSGLWGLLWERVPQQSPAELRQWVGLAAPADSPAPAGGGHHYQFARLASPLPLNVQTVSWPMIIGIGSGLSLILGLMFQYVPATRNVVALLVIGFALAVAGIWYATPVVLLLQASVLGLLLAVISAVIQMTIRRRRSTVVTMPTASGVGSSTGSSFEHDVISVGGSKPLVRPQSASDSAARAESIPSSTVSGASQ